MDDMEYMYDLFSVIIHKGGCYGGHYHVYIKDVDHLGNWQCQVSLQICLEITLKLTCISIPVTEFCRHSAFGIHPSFRKQ